MKLKYRLRNMFFPRKHDKLVYEIRKLLIYVKVCRDKVKYYDELMEHMYFGDKAWDTYDEWRSSLRYYEKQLKEKKEQWKSKQSRVWRISKNPM